jgi:hypothetical protein
MQRIGGVHRLEFDQRLVRAVHAPAIARSVIVWAISPRACANFTTSSGRVCWTCEIETSPPRMERPSAAMPPVIDAATELTPAIAATPRRCRRRGCKTAQAAAHFAQSEANASAGPGPSRIIRPPPRAKAAWVPLRVDRAVAHPHDAPAPFREPNVMGDEHQRRAAFLLLGEKQVGHLPPRLAVQIAGRLVRDQDERVGRKRAGNRHTLLFAARQLAGIVAFAPASPTAASSMPRLVECVAVACQFQRDGNVFQRRHVRDQMEGLEDNADIAATEACEHVFAPAPSVRCRRP